MNSRVKHSYQTIKSLKNFGATLLVFQIVIFLLYIRFVRYQITPTTDPLDHQRTMALFSINLMVVVGFGLFMGFIKNHTISPLAFVLLIVCVSYQLYVLFYGFWNRIFIGFSSFPISIDFDQKLFIRSARCALACVIGIGSAAGRLAPKDILKILPIIICGYALNEAVVEIQISAFDAGGTMLVHTYGSFFALTLSFITAKKLMPHSMPIENYQSSTLALMGTLFLWIGWPAFNYSLYASNPFERTLIITNTIYALLGSCISTLIISALYKRGFTMLMIHRATWAGGVVIGASAPAIYVPALSFSLGIAAGIGSTLSLRYLQGKFQIAWGLLDTCGILSSSAIPSLLGGLSCSMILVGYYYSGFNQKIVTLSSPTKIFKDSLQLNKQGGLQAAALFISIGLGVFCGLISGFLVSLYYKEDPQTFYSDQWLFDASLFEQSNQLIEYTAVEAQGYNVASEDRLQTKERQNFAAITTSKKVFKTRYNF